MSSTTVSTPASEEAPTGVLGRLYEMNRGTIILKRAGTEIPVGLRLLPLAEAMGSGVLPTAITNRVLEAKKNGHEFSVEELAQIATEAVADERTAERLREFVARSIETLWGEAVELQAKDTLQFTDDEFALLLRYCTREEPLPGKA